jgi:hypothetical protein
MAENWQCAKCGSLNPQRRSKCWHCGFDRLTIAVAPSRPPEIAQTPPASRNQGELLGEAEGTDRPQVVTAPATIQRQLKEPSILVSLLFTVLLIVILQGGGILLALFWPGSVEDFQRAALGLNYAVRLVIGYVSVGGAKPIGAKPLHYIGMMLLAFLPILSWISAYYAGKAIARKFMK